MNRRGWFCLGLLVLAGCGKGAAPLPLPLGLVATLTGPDKAAGEQAKRGMLLAVQEHNAEAKEKNGRPLVVRFSDAQGQVETFEGAAVRLASINRVAALFGGNTVEEVVRLERARVPVLTPLGWKTAGMGDQVFCTGLGPAYQGQVLARFVLQDAKITRLAVVVDEQREEALVLAAACQRELQKTDAKPGVKPVVRPVGWRSGKDADFTDLARRVEAEKAQAVVFAGQAGDLLLLKKHLKTAPRLLFGGPEGSGKILRDAGGDGILLVTAFVPDLDLPQTKEFVRQYRAAYSETPEAHAALAHDALRLVAEGLKKCDPTPTPDRLRTELVEIKDFLGLSGPLAFAKDGRLRRPAFLVQIDQGNVKLVKKFGAEE